jgi:hypothetical protein
MPDFDEARWQDVEKKASDELDGIERQNLSAVPILSEIVRDPSAFQASGRWRWPPGG